MNKSEEIIKAADEIMMLHYKQTFSMRVALKHAIIDVQGTIRALSSLEERNTDGHTWYRQNVVNQLEDYTLLLKELEIRSSKLN